MSQSLFPSTHWSIVVQIQRGESEGESANQAVDELCAIYWRPVYFFVRWKGLSPEDAQDVTQEIFSSLVGARRFEQVSPEHGTLRSFLKAVAVRHVNEFLRFEGRKKRGGGTVRVQFDSGEVESILSQESEVAEPEAAFDRKWALEILDAAAGDLRKKHEKAGRTDWFEALYPQITPSAGSKRYSELADQLGTSLSSIKVGVHRMRQQYREVLRARVAETVEGDEALEQELAALQAALS